MIQLAMTRSVDITTFYEGIIIDSNGVPYNTIERTIYVINLLD